MREKLNSFNINMRIMCIAIFLTIVYAISTQLLGAQEIYYRTWVVILGDIISFIVLPLSLAANFLKGKTWMKILEFSVLFVVLLFTTLGLRLSRWEKEEFIQENIIECTETLELESVSYHEYYSSYNPFFKRKYKEISNLVKARAEERYGMEFKVKEENLIKEMKETVSVYTLYPVSDPALEVHMFGLNIYYEFMDDYGQALVNYRLQQNTELANYVVMDSDTSKTVFQTYGKDIPKVAAPTIKVSSADEFQSVSELLAECLNEALLPNEKQSGCVYLCGEVPVIGPYNRSSYVGLLEYEQIPKEERAAYLYQLFLDSYEENNEPERVEELKNEVELIQGTDISTSETVEGAYRRLFDKVYGPLEYEYNGYYNAKGNFYGVLNTGKEKIDETDENAQELDFEQTVVYDRVSKNGKCHLFVQYKNYYDENGKEVLTEIVDMYAVDMETGEVIISDKHAWEDVGSDEYREATGE